MSSLKEAPKSLYLLSLSLAVESESDAASAYSHRAKTCTN